MKIEEVINQIKLFRNDCYWAMVNLIYIYNWVVDQLWVKIKFYGIIMQQYNVLWVLCGVGELISIFVIRECLLDKMVDIFCMVYCLVQKGLVVCWECVYDKCLVDVLLSEDGYVMLYKFDVFDVEVDWICGVFIEKEVVQFSDLLDKLCLD